MVKYKIIKEKTSFKSTKITTSDDCFKCALQLYDSDIEVYEIVYAIMLNASCKTLGFAKISQGGITSSIIDPLIVAKYAIGSLAKNIILVHNHPSESEKPSNEDIKVTKDIKEMLKLLNINLLDHIIITKNNYYSFADNNNIL